MLPFVPFSNAETIVGATLVTVIVRLSAVLVSSSATLKLTLNAPS